MSRTGRALTFAVAFGCVVSAYGGSARAEVIAADSTSSSMVRSGVVTLGLSYAAAAVVAATSSHPGDNRLFVPILGPWLDLGSRGSCPVESSNCDHETTNKVLIIGDGVIQAAGAVTILAGLLHPGPAVVATKRFTIAQIVPVSLGAGRPGLAAFGTF